MPSPIESALSKLSRLNTFRRGDRRAPHKPLLLLIAIGALIRGKRELPFRRVEEELIPLLKAFAPPVVGRHQPELPYWHLMTDGLWEVPGANELPRQAGGFPRLAALRDTVGHLSDDIATVVTTDPAGTELIIESLLDKYFPQTIQEEVLAAVGIDRKVPAEIQDIGPVCTLFRYRNPRFRENVLRAYEHQCAATGFRAALGGSYFGCEAAHVKWHAYGGPDDVANGIALEPTIHKLFDAGAWTLTDTRRILVSKEFTGSDQAIALLRNLHGKPLRNPLPGEPPVSPEFIRWHREAALGGVFRSPELPLEA
jgi:putative restriction endonuclease